MKTRPTLVLIIILSLFLLGLDRAGALAVPRNWIGGVLEPIQFGWYRMTSSLQSSLGTLGQIGTLGVDNLDLRGENDRLKARIGALGRLEEENNLLRKQLEIPETRQFRILPASTLGFLPAATTRELIISEGFSSGAAIGQAVIIEKIILGKIVSVQADRATVRLLTDPSSKVVATTTNGAKGLLVGQFQSFAKLTKVLQNESLNVSDLVFTSGEDGWPKGFVIGEVVKVTKKDNELFQEAEIKPQLNYDKIDTVFIILGLR